MKRAFILFMLLFAAVSCQQNSYNTFSRKYRVWFSFNVMDDPFNQTVIPSHFIAVRKTGGKLVAINPGGKETTVNVSPMEFARYQMGLAGLIIGTPAFNNYESAVWAYDLGCPECDDPKTRLTIDVQGTASCSECHGAWNLNADGFPINDNSTKPLMRYPVTRADNTVTIAN